MPTGPGYPYHYHVRASSDLASKQWSFQRSFSSASDPEFNHKVLVELERISKAEFDESALVPHHACAGRDSAAAAQRAPTAAAGQHRAAAAAHRAPAATAQRSLAAAAALSAPAAVAVHRSVAATAAQRASAAAAVQHGASAAVQYGASAGVPREERACGGCGRSGPVVRLMHCNRCRAAWYCSKACQTTAWRSGHKRECTPVAGSAQLSQA